MAETIGFAKMRRTPASKIERVMKRVAEFPRLSAVSFGFLAPTACPMQTVVPIAKPTIMTVNMCMI